MTSLLCPQMWKWCLKKNAMEFWIHQYERKHVASESTSQQLFWSSPSRANIVSSTGGKRTVLSKCWRGYSICRSFIYEAFFFFLCSRKRTKRLNNLPSHVPPTTSATFFRAESIVCLADTPGELTKLNVTADAHAFLGLGRETKGSNPAKLRCLDRFNDNHTGECKLLKVEFLCTLKGW